MNKHQLSFRVHVLLKPPVMANVSTLNICLLSGLGAALVIIVILYLIYAYGERKKETFPRYPKKPAPVAFC